MPLSTIHAIESCPNIAITRAGDNDVAEIGDLFEKVVLFLPYYNEAAKQSEILKYRPHRLKEMIAADIESIQVAKIDGQVVGFCFSNIDDGLIWLSWFGVDPEYRRHGIGTSLLTAIDGRARRARAHKIWCDCRTNNIASHLTLATFGYRELCKLDNHWYGQDFLLWERSVA